MSEDSEFSIRHPDPSHVYGSTKTYCHNVGLSAAFRQWRADSHCRFIHGYALEVKVTFEGLLDERNWCVDFGSLKSFKGWLEDTFDHKTLVATDDPELPMFRELDKKGIIQLREVPSTGCEAFSRIVYEYLEQWLRDNGYTHINLRCVEVREHGANSAYYRYF